MTLISRDQAVIWHPFTQHQTISTALPIARGEGAYLIDEQGKRYLDLISSWWVNLHGHSHPEIAKAVYEQAMTLEHVIFSGFTHEPAVSLAEKLLQLLPTNMKKVFYSDSGSTAVEIALKMAYQYWYNQGESQRQRFIAFEHGYHGDTFGAMAVGKHSGFFAPFENLLFTVETFPYPATWLTDDDIARKEEQVINQLATYLKQYGHETAALILEPLVQGSAGMHMCRPEFLQSLERLVKSYGVIIIYDEVMTGFGRTGEYFACLKAGTTPDIICFAKGLTGGFLPLSVTACQQHIYDAFLGPSFATALAHGHSYTANPLGCAAGLASLAILQSSETRQQLSMLESVHQQAMLHLAALEVVEKPRYCGTIAAFDLKLAAKYGSKISYELRDKFLARGLIIRPLGNTIYLLPPYCITRQELEHTYDILLEEVRGVKT